MKKKLALFATPLVMLATTGTAVANMDCCFSPYLGVDAQIRHMPFQRHFGGNVLKKNYPQGNFFAGFKFNDCFGIEAGYEVSKKKSGSRNNVNGAPIFGIAPLPLDEFTLSAAETSHAHARIHGWNINLMGYLPVLCPEDCVQLVGGLGLAQLRHKVRNTLFVTEVFSDGDTVHTVVNSNFNKRKVVLRLTGGIQHMLTECFGVRALVNWENTSRLHAQGRRAGTRERLESVAKAKNSFNYGLGIFASF